MPRGGTAEEGATFVNANGYSYTKVAGSWKATAHVVAEQKLGRPLREDEMTRFADGDRANLHPNNITVVKRPSKSVERKKASLQARIAELQAQLAELE